MIEALEFHWHNPYQMGSHLSQEMIPDYFRYQGRHLNASNHRCRGLPTPKAQPIAGARRGDEGFRTPAVGHIPESASASASITFLATYPLAPSVPESATRSAEIAVSISQNRLSLR